MSIDRTEAAPRGSESTPDVRPTPAPPSQPQSVEAQLAHARRALDALRATHRQLMDLLGTERPEKIVHDLRNVLNELQLLRLLSDSEKC